MNPTSIGFASRRYGVIEQCEIIRHDIDHDELHHISYALQALNKSLESEAGEEYWRQTLGPVRRFVFTLCSTPLPPSFAATALCINWEKLHHQVRLCQHLYPDRYAPLSDLVQKIELLSEKAYSPFTTLLESLCRESGMVYAVLHNQRINKYASSYFAKNVRLRNIKVISTRQLKEDYWCDCIVIFGACKWIPDYIFSAPRAQHVHVIKFRWIRDAWKPGTIFLSDSQSEKDGSSRHYIGKLPKIINKQATSICTLPNIEALDLFPPVPSFKKEILHYAGWQPTPNEETMQAKFCTLSGGRAVFVSADEDTSQLVIDLSNTGNAIVKRLSASALEPDIYLLLRTAGGGDFIAPLADRILGNLAKERRAQQAEWKNQLISTAQNQFGVASRRDLSTRVSSYLLVHGLSSARPANIHYWMSSKCIHPRKKEDFIAVLTFAGMADRAQELWEAMGEIGRAHRRAGHTIRKMLLQRISNVSLEPLERDGEMTFDLGEQDGGALSAFQITRISEEEFDIPVNLIGVLLDLEEQQWLA